MKYKLNSVNRKIKRVDWLPEIPVMKGSIPVEIWGYFSKSGKTLEIYISDPNSNIGGRIKFKITRKMMDSGLRK